MSILRERGFAALTLDEVTRRAGVGKSSLYARFKNRAELAAAAVASLQRDPPSSSGELRTDLIGYLRALDRDLGTIGSELLGSPRHDTHSQVEDRSWLLGPLARHTRRLLSAASARGQLRGDTDLAAAAAVLVGALLVRQLLGSNEEQSWVDRVVDTILDGVASRA